MLDDIYNPQILNLAAHISHIGRLKEPQATAFKQAKYCGSTIQVDLKMQQGIVSDFAQTIQACALGQASAAIVAQHIIGTSADDMKALHQTVMAMLQEGGAPPQGRFAQFALLQPVKDYKARHGSTLLVLDAIIDCIYQIEMRQKGEGHP